MSARHHKRKTKKSDIGVCHYHLCRKRTKVYKCKYCGEYFCKEHLKAKPPGLPNFKTTTHRDRFFMEEWHKPGGHPCVPYLEHWEAENQRKEEGYRQALDKLIRSKPLKPHHEPEVIHRGEPIRRKVSVAEKIENYWYWNKRKIIKTIIILIILAVVVATVFYVFQNKTEFINKFEEFKSNLNIELSGNIELILSYVIIGAVIISGLLATIIPLEIKKKLISLSVLILLLFTIAPWAYDNIEKSVENLDFSEVSEIQKVFAVPPERKAQCKEAFDYLNQLRENYSRSKLAWDDRIYELAVFRSKDMYQRGYFDHVTPEGKCAEHFKKEFNITEFGTFAENIGGMTHYENGDPVPETNVKEAIDGWMSSRGHRYALLYPYPNYKKGATGCYKYICTFLVLTTEPFECVHGEEGLEYWKTVPRQPGEVG